MFVKQFNDKTANAKGMMTPVVITVYSDRSFEFAIKSPPAAVLLKQAAGMPIEKKAGGKQIPAEELAKKSGKYKGFKVTKKQVREIAERKEKRPERPRSRSCRAHHGRNGPLDGNYGRRIIDPVAPDP